MEMRMKIRKITKRPYGSNNTVLCAFIWRSMFKIREKCPDPLLQINLVTASQLDIIDGDDVYIKTPLGKVLHKAKLIDNMHPKAVHADGYWWYPEKEEAEPSLFGAWESNINSILPGDPKVCDYTGNNYLRGLLCKVYKANIKEEPCLI
jgi:anaerobic selenocysteine-containing dehydrogenase